MTEDKKLGTPIFITKESTTTTLDGQVMKNKLLTVQGKTLKECQEYFDKNWEE